MGQNVSTAADIIPDTWETVHYEVMKQVKTLTEINDLSYEDFQTSMSELNDLSNRVFENSGHKLVFAIKKSSADTMLLWKATVRIACVKVNTSSNKIESYKLLNLKQFLRVFKTFQSHLEVMVASESQARSNAASPTASPNAHPQLSASVLMREVENFSFSPERVAGVSSSDQLFNECCICLDRKPEILLPCVHVYCVPCIEQWNMNHKSCPICQEKLDSTDDTWVISELPDMQEVNEEIFSELSKLSKE